MQVLNKIILSLFILFGCVEPYKFIVKNNNPTLVVEAYISNVSFNESMSFPSSGRYFTVGLHYTSDVINRKDVVISNADVKLSSKSGGEWQYVESEDSGNYYLLDKDFEVVSDDSYQLKIDLPNGKYYQSDWEKLPEAKPETMGNIGFEETTMQVFEVEAGEKVIRTIQGVNVYVELPENKNVKSIFYRWNFTPDWIYIAPLASSRQPDKKCWATNIHYLSNYTLQIDNVGGYRKNLFFIESVRNDRIYEDLSVLVHQQAMSEKFYYFWKEMKEQTENAGLFDNPPFNLETNIHQIGGDENVSGYFGVVDEKAKRWYFSIKDLSYNVRDELRNDCLVVYGPGGPAKACNSCLAYPNGIATIQKPVWWH